MSRKRNPFPGVGNRPVIDRHGKKRWRLRKIVKGRKIDTYLPGPYGSAEFRMAYDAALNTVPEVRSAGALGTFDHVITTYRGNKRFKELARSTRYAKGKRLDWIREIIGGADMAKLQPYHIENLMDRKGGPDAANRLLKEISELYTFAKKKMGMDLPNPAGAVDRRKTREGGYHTWSDAQVEQFREAHPSGSKARLAFELMLATGAARQDACGMGRHNIKGDAIYYRRGKTGQETELPLRYMPELVAEIVQLPHDTALFLTHGSGAPYTPESFGNWFAEQCQAAELPDECRAHGLRKYGATRLAERGANELQIAAFLAHKDTRQAKVYVRSAERRKLVSDAMALAHGEGKVSNLSEWLDKCAPQTIENRRK
ncbi:MAG: tyrosine-type recombinase/integrase [Roseovarius sp.]